MKNKKSSTIKRVAVYALSGLAVAGLGVTACTLINKSNEFKVTLDYNIQGVKDQQQTVKKDTQIKDLKIEPVEGYEFKGWYKDKACTQKYLPTDIVTANSTIYIKLEVVTYAVIFPTSDYYTINKSSSIVDFGNTLTFTIQKQEGALDAEPVVKANGQVLTPDANGVYTIPNVVTNYTVTVEGIEPELHAFSIVVNGEPALTMKVEPGTTSSQIYDSEAFLNFMDTFNYNQSCGFFADEELLEVIDPTENFVVDAPINIYTKMAKQTETELVLPISQTSLDTSVIKNNGIQNVVLPSSWTAISSSQFEDCSSLKTINIHNNIQSIGGAAFRKAGLERLVIKHNLTVGNGTFHRCDNLRYVYWNSNLDSTGNSYTQQLLFANCKIDTFIIGKDVEVFDDDSALNEGANYYGGLTYMLPIKELIYEDSTKSVQDSTDYHEGFLMAENITINDQNRFDSLNGTKNAYWNMQYFANYSYYAENFGNFYIKDTIEGANNFTVKETNLSGYYGIDGEVTLTKVTSDRAGYIKYVLDYESPVATIYLDGQELTKLKVTSARLVQDVYLSDYFGDVQISGPFLDADAMTVAGSSDYITDGMKLYYFTATTDELDISYERVYGEYAYVAYIKAGSTAKTIILPYNCKHIKYNGNAADLCVENIIIPASWTQINSGVFYGITSLKTVNIHNGIKNIGGTAFENSGIEELVINHNLEHIGENAFKNCKNLKYVYWNSNFIEGIYDGYYNTFPFEKSVIDKFVIGKDVTNFDEERLFHGIYTGSGGPYHYYGMCLINTVVYENSQNPIAMSTVTGINGGTMGAKTVVINDQNRFDSFNGILSPIVDMILLENGGSLFKDNIATIYIKEDIDGANTFTILEDDDFVLTNHGKQTAGEYAGYYKYDLSLNSTNINTIKVYSYIGGKQPEVLMVTTGKTIYDVIDEIVKFYDIESDIKGIYYDAEYTSPILESDFDNQLTENMSIYVDVVQKVLVSFHYNGIQADLTLWDYYSIGEAYCDFWDYVYDVAGEEKAWNMGRAYYDANFTQIISNEDLYNKFITANMSIYIKPTEKVSVSFYVDGVLNTTLMLEDWSYISTAFNEFYNILYENGQDDLANSIEGGYYDIDHTQEISENDYYNYYITAGMSIYIKTNE